MTRLLGCLGIVLLMPYGAGAWNYRGTMTDDSGANAVVTIGHGVPHQPGHDNLGSFSFYFRCAGPACFARRGVASTQPNLSGGPGDTIFTFDFVPHFDVCVALPRTRSGCGGLVGRYTCYRRGGGVIGAGVISLVAGFGKCPGGK